MTKSSMLYGNIPDIDAAIQQRQQNLANGSTPGAVGRDLSVQRWDGKLPTQEKIVQANQTTEERMANWDYKTSQFGPNGEQLPKGAQGWDPKGNPYYGEGLSGWWKRFSNAMTAPLDLPEGEVTLKSQGGLTSKDYKVSGVGETLAKAGSAVAQKGGTLIKEGFIGGTLEVLNQVEEQTERWLGGAVMVNDEMQKYSGLPDLPDTPAQAVRAGVQALGGKDAAIEPLKGVTGWMEDVWKVDETFGKFFPNFTPVHTLYNGLRTSVGQIKAGFAIMRGEDPGLTPVKENFEAARMAYTALYDEGRKAEYIRRLADGENPDLLRMELENPYVEIALGMVIDPIDMIPFDLIKRGQNVARFADEFDIVPELKKIIEGVDDFSDQQKTVIGAADFIATAQSSAKKIGTELDDFAKKTGLFDLTANGKRAVVGERTQNMLGWVSNTLTGRDPDEACNVMEALVKLHSDDTKQVSEAVSILARQSDPRPLFSRAGMEAGYVLKNVMGDNPTKFLNELEDTQNVDDLLKLADVKIGKTVDSMFPTVREMVEQGANVSPVTKFAANADFFLKGQKNAPVTIINKFFSSLYMGMSPSYAFRNVFTNTAQVFVDQGLDAAALAGRSQFSKMFGGEGFVADLGEKLKRWNGGADLPAAFRGFGTPVASAGVDLGDKANVFNAFQKLSEKAEEGASVAVAYTAFSREMRRMLQEGRAIPKMDDLIQAGIDRNSANVLSQLIVDNYGNVDEALSAFREATKIGSINILETSEWLKKSDADYLRGINQHDDLLKAVREAKTKDEAIKYVDELERELRRQAAKAGNEIPVIDPEDMGNLFGGDLNRETLKAFEDGYLKWTKPEAGIRNAQIITNNNVVTAYERAMTDAIEAAILKDPANMEEYKRLQQTLKNFRNGRAMHNADYQEKILDAMMSRRDAIIRANTADIPKLWNKYFPETPAPEGLTKEVLRNAAWEQFFGKRSDYWKLAREQYSNAGEKWFAELQKLTGEPYPLLDQARAQVENARKFDNVEFVMKDGNLFWNGKGEKMVPNHVINTVNKYLGTDYKKLDEISIEELDKAFKTRATQKATEQGKTLLPDELPSVISTDDYRNVERIAGEQMDEAALEGVGFSRLEMPYDGSTATHSRMYRESFNGGLDGMFENIRKTINSNWGVARPIGANTNADKLLAGWANEAKARISRARLAATEIATHERDMVLLNYGTKRNLDMVASYIFPYQFWHSRTYLNWMKRTITATPVISAYGKYREFMQSIHAGMPEWWKYNINTNELFGLNSEHPLYFNLEATLNPLNALVGIDFRDDQKRVDYWTAMLDDISKVGPSVWTPLNWATALALYQQGEEDAGARWLGRLIPQTATIKALTSLTGLNTKGGAELDPFVNFIMGGSDPYERNRIGRGVSTLAQQGKITQAQAEEASQMQSGPVWDQAAQLATNARAPGQLISYFLGVGFKGRSEADMQTDYMYTDYFQLMNMRPDLSPQEFSTKMDEIRQKYPFMDTVLISRKGGYERDTAYAYSVMRRIPPGQTNEVAELAGIDPRLLSRFFDDKGAIEKWPKQDRDELINGMITIGAVLDLPATATRTEWTNAKNAYNTMKQEGESKFGKNIWDEADGFFDAEDRDEWLKAHPNARKAMDWKDAYIVNDPLLSQYYGGIGTIERYYNSWFAREAEKKFGANIQATIDEYNRLKNGGGPYKAYKKEHPEIGQFYDMKDDWKETIKEHITAAGLMLKEGQPAVTRQDLPENMSFSQQDLSQSMQAQPEPMFSWADWKALLPNDIEGKLFSREPLTEKEEDRLIKKAQALGIGYDTMLDMIYQSIGLTE